MSGRIHILSDIVINRIAAGEVVERPASVVKELVENALDAGARSVEVTLHTGGRDRVEVSDDGTGMSSEDAVLALERHATSKIASDEDLHALSTFGFRGEALPSIASVSRLILESCEGDGADGTRLVVEGGTLQEQGPAARRHGTTVIVEHLFANVPARRKFLRTAQTEYRHALNAVTEAALSRLDVAFRLEHDGREAFRLAAGEGLRERAQALFGGRSLKGAVTLGVEADDLRLTGILGSPAAARRSAAGVHLFVNGRPVNHRGLSYALYTGYGELLAGGSYPFACLFLEVSPGQVDVNVHPAKREVRFGDEPRVKDFVISAVSETLSRELGAPPLALTPFGGRGSAGGGQGGAGHAPLRPDDLPWKDLGLFGAATEEARRSAEQLFQTMPAPDAASVRETLGDLDGRTEAPVGEEGEGLAVPGIEPVIWQIHDRYLLAPIKGGLLIVDQHAAHERVLYERTLAQLRGEPGASQQLLFPRVLDVSAEQAALVEELADLLSRIGYDVRPFGGFAVALEAVPPGVERAGREEEVLIALLDDLSEGGSRGSGVQEKIAASLACHAAIRFGDRMDPQQRRGLVDQLFACERPQVCPHGRPTHLVLGLEELERRFGR